MVTIFVALSYLLIMPRQLLRQSGILQHVFKIFLFFFFCFLLFFAFSLFIPFLRYQLFFLFLSLFFFLFSSSFGQRVGSRAGEAKGETFEDERRDSGICLYSTLFCGQLDAVNLDLGLSNSQQGVKKRVEEHLENVENDTDYIQKQISRA